MEEEESLQTSTQQQSLSHSLPILLGALHHHHNSESSSMTYTPSSVVTKMEIYTHNKNSSNEDNESVTISSMGSATSYPTLNLSATKEETKLLGKCKSEEEEEEEEEDEEYFAQQELEQTYPPKEGHLPPRHHPHSSTTYPQQQQRSRVESSSTIQSSALSSSSSSSSCELPDMLLNTTTPTITNKSLVVPTTTTTTTTTTNPSPFLEDDADAEQSHDNSWTTSSSYTYETDLQSQSQTSLQKMDNKMDALLKQLDRIKNFQEGKIGLYEINRLSEEEGEQMEKKVIKIKKGAPTVSSIGFDGEVSEEEEESGEEEERWKDRISFAQLATRASAVAVQRRQQLQESSDLPTSLSNQQETKDKKGEKEVKRENILNLVKMASARAAATVEMIQKDQYEIQEEDEKEGNSVEDDLGSSSSKENYTLEEESILEGNPTKIKHHDEDKGNFVEDDLGSSSSKEETEDDLITQHPQKRTSISTHSLPSTIPPNTSATCTSEEEEDVVALMKAELDFGNDDEEAPNEKKRIASPSHSTNLQEEENYSKRLMTTNEAAIQLGLSSSQQNAKFEKLDTSAAASIISNYGDDDDGSTKHERTIASSSIHKDKELPVVSASSASASSSSESDTQSEQPIYQYEVEKKAQMEKHLWNKYLSTTAASKSYSYQEEEEQVMIVTTKPKDEESMSISALTTTTRYEEEEELPPELEEEVYDHVTEHQSSQPQNSNNQKEEEEDINRMASLIKEKTAKMMLFMKNEDEPSLPSPSLSSMEEEEDEYNAATVKQSQHQNIKNTPDCTLPAAANNITTEKESKTEKESTSSKSTENKTAMDMLQKHLTENPYHPTPSFNFHKKQREKDIKKHATSVEEMQEKLLSLGSGKPQLSDEEEKVGIGVTTSEALMELDGGINKRWSKDEIILSEDIGGVSKEEEEEVEDVLPSGRRRWIGGVTDDDDDDEEGDGDYNTPAIKPQSDILDNAKENDDEVQGVENNHLQRKESTSSSTQKQEKRNMERLERTIVELTLQLANAKSQLDIKNLLCLRLSEERCQTLTELENVSREHLQLSKKNAVLTKENEELVKRKDDDGSVVKGLEGENTILKERNGTLEARVKELELLSSNQRTVIDDLRIQAEKCALDRRSTDERIIELQTEREKNRGELNTTGMALQKAEHKVNEFKHVNGELENEVERLKWEEGESKGIIQDMMRERDALRRDVGKLMRENDDLASQIDDGGRRGGSRRGGEGGWFFGNRSRRTVYDDDTLSSLSQYQQGDDEEESQKHQRGKDQKVKPPSTRRVIELESEWARRGVGHHNTLVLGGGWGSVILNPCRRGLLGALGGGGDSDLSRIRRARSAKRRSSFNKDASSQASVQNGASEVIEKTETS